MIIVGMLTVGRHFAQPPETANEKVNESYKALPVWKITFQNETGKTSGKTLACEVALDSETKARGLMYRTSLDENACMIFPYDMSRILRFWMRNTLIPLSIAYIDARFVVVDIFNMLPLDETPVLSTRPVKYAVETNQGWYEKNGVKPGDIMHIVKEGESG